jgi:hypothetical protein
MESDIPYRSFREQAVALRSAPIIEFTRSVLCRKRKFTAIGGTSEKCQKGDYKALNGFLLTEPMRLMEKRFHGSTHFESGREAVVDHAFRPARHRQHLRRRWARYGRVAAGGLIDTHYEPAAVLQALRPSAGPASARYRRNRKVRFRGESQLSGHGVLGQDGLTWFAKLDDKAWHARSGHEGVSETGSSGTP